MTKKYYTHKFCSVEGCTRPYASKGYCLRHYVRVRDYGTTEPHVFKYKVGTLHTCSHCNNQFKRTLGGSVAKRYSETGIIFCSRSCYLNSRYGENRDLIARISKEVNALKRIAKYKETIYRKTYGCLDCKCTLTYFKYGLRGTPKKRCDECNVKNKKFLKKNCKSLRKARKKYQTVGRGFNPYLVFIRDGWKCQLCGVSTPESRRGKLYKNSPELDHIVPLSKGGEHSIENTQCLCRECNLYKSNKYIIGQIGLFKDMPQMGRGMKSLQPSI